MRRFARQGREGGAVAIEFALILPLFLMILYGIVSYSIYFVALHDMNRLSGEAVRAAMALERGENGLPEEAAIDSLVSRGWIDERAVFSGLIEPCASEVVSASREVRVCLTMNSEAFPLPVINNFLGLGITIPDINNARITSRVSL